MMKGICLGEKANQKSSREPAIGRAGASPFAFFKPENEKPSAQDLERAARFSHHFAEIDILPRPVVQSKLVVGSPGDKYEQEADRVAEQVMSAISSSDHISVQRDGKRGEGSEEEDELRRKPTVAGLLPAVEITNVEPDLASAIQQSRGKGQPLSDGVRHQMERAFGADFGGVRVHTGAQADSLNRSIQARAFTAGLDIFLRQGEYVPRSSGGQKLLAHELTHVLQQSSRLKNAQVVQREQDISSDIGNFFITIREDRCVEVSYAEPSGNVQGGARCNFRTGRCELVGGPAGGPTYTIEEMLEMLRGWGAESQTGSPGESISPRICPRGQILIGSSCQTISLPTTPQDIPQVEPISAAENPSIQLPSSSIRSRDYNLQVIDHFAVNDASVPVAAFGRLDWIADEIVLHNVPSIIVQGHTDSRATDEYNLELSLRRAQTVKAELINRGVAADRITIEGLGEQQLAVRPERSDEDYARNRRVEISWMQPSGFGFQYHLIPPLELPLH